jgi:hypothetical protein
MNILISAALNLKNTTFKSVKLYVPDVLKTDWEYKS